MDPRAQSNLVDLVELFPRPISDGDFAAIRSPIGGRVNRALLERKAVASFAAFMYALGDLRNPSHRTRLHVMEAIRAIVPAIDIAACDAPAGRYGRRVLWEDPAAWSLAAISLRYAQETEAHDHAGWGGAVVVQGIERDRRYRMNDAGELELMARRDYRPGSGYLFDAADIHQPIGADPRQLTVALHFLAHDAGRHQHHLEVHA